MLIGVNMFLTLPQFNEFRVNFLAEMSFGEFYLEVVINEILCAILKSNRECSRENTATVSHLTGLEPATLWFRRSKFNNCSQ